MPRVKSPLQNEHNDSKKKSNSSEMRPTASSAAIPDTGTEPSGPVLLVAGEPPAEVVLDASEGHKALLHFFVFLRNTEESERIFRWLPGETRPRLHLAADGTGRNATSLRARGTFSVDPWRKLGAKAIEGWKAYGA
jgi:hypothetical protein